MDHVDGGADRLVLDSNLIRWVGAPAEITR